MKIKYLFISPQAGHGLGQYDFKLLSNIKIDGLGYVGNIKFDWNLKNVYVKKFFKYLDKRGLAKGASYILSLFKLFFFLLKTKPKVVHVNWVRLPLVEYVFYKFTRRICGFKMVYTAHNVLPHDTGERYAGIYKKLYLLADAVIVHSKYSLGEMDALQIPHEKVHVIKHGCFDMNPNSKNAFNFRKRYNLNNKIIFSLIGVQSKYKGTDIAIDAWTDCPDILNSENCVLVIMGKNVDIDYSKAQRAKNILIIDKYYSEEENLSILNASDVMLLPYRKISQSGVLQQSFNYHIPLIVADTGGLAETLDVAKIGWVVTPGNVNELSKTILKLLKEPQRIIEVKNNKMEWEKIIKYYSWEDIGKKTVELYNYVLNQA